MEYTEQNRGRFQNERRAKQLIEFAGIRRDNCTPTDIDGFMEIHDKIYIFFEIKHGDAEVPRGQKIALMRLCDNLRMAGKVSVVFVGRHYIDDEETNVLAADTDVTEIYFDGRWYNQKKQKLGVMVDKFIELAMKEGKWN